MPNVTGLCVCVSVPVSVCTLVHVRLNHHNSGQMSSADWIRQLYVITKRGEVKAVESVHVCGDKSSHPPFRRCPVRFFDLTRLLREQ